MNYTLKGKLIYIGQIEQITDKFRKRIIVIEPEEQRYPQKISLQLLGENTDMSDTLRIGDIVEADFVIKGRESKGRYFNSLDIIRLAFIESETTVQPEQSFSEFTELGSEAKPDVGEIQELPF